MRRLWVFALSVASARAQGAFDCASLCEGFSCDSYSPQTCDAALSEFGCACAGCACDVARNGTNATNATVLRAAAEAVLGSIVDVAAATPELSSLVAAVAAAGLVGALAGDGPFTVLAPTNAAFEAVDLAALSDDELVDVLLYHVVPGVHAAADLAGVDGLETLYGQDVGVDVAEDGAVTFGGAATVVIADVEASNGVVHVREEEQVVGHLGAELQQRLDGQLHAVVDAVDEGADRVFQRRLTVAVLRVDVGAGGLKAAQSRNAPIFLRTSRVQAAQGVHEGCLPPPDANFSSVVRGHVVPMPYAPEHLYEVLAFRRALAHAGRPAAAAAAHAARIRGARVPHPPRPPPDRVGAQ